MSPTSSESARRRPPLFWAALGGALLLACDGLPALSPSLPASDVPAACGNGADDDADGLADYPADPGCESLDDPGEDDPAQPRACSDGVDNDGDGRVDFDQNHNGQVDGEDDPGCHSAASDDEGGALLLPQCADGVDNDRDGSADYPADNQCSSRNDTDESR